MHGGDDIMRIGMLVQRHAPVIYPDIDLLLKLSLEYRARLRLAESPDNALYREQVELATRNAQLQTIRSRDARRDQATRG